MVGRLIHKVDLYTSKYGNIIALVECDNQHDWLMIKKTWGEVILKEI